MVRPVARMAARLRRALAAALDLCLALLLAAVVAIAAAQVVLRYAFADAILWAEEVSVIAMVWFVAVGAARLWLSDAHIAVPLLADALPPWGRRALRLAHDAAAVAAGIALVVAARPLVTVYATIMLDTVPASSAWKYGALVAAGGALAAAGAIRMAGRLAGDDPAAPIAADGDGPRDVGTRPA